MCLDYRCSNTQIQHLNNFIYLSCVFIFLVYDSVIGRKQTKGSEMEGLDRAQRAYDRMEPDYDDEPETEHCIDANQLTDGEILEFVMDWVNDESVDESSLEYITIEAWFCDLPLSYKARKWVEKWARQAAFEAQLPANLKRQASIN